MARALGLCLVALALGAWRGFLAPRRPNVARRAQMPNIGELMGSMGKVSEAMKKMPERETCRAVVGNERKKHETLMEIIENLMDIDEKR